jgi:hypothetical protein
MSEAINLKTRASLQKAGYNALVKELGADDAMRFIRLFNCGYGDYTKERHDIFDGMSVDGIFEDMEQWQKNAAVVD